MERKIIAIIGPTASGKTGIGVKVAQDFNGEIVSADSRQVYRGLDIGTGKEGVPKARPTTDNRQQTTVEKMRSHLQYIKDIPQWMIDVCSLRLEKVGASPEEEFNLFKYLELARLVIDDIFARGKVPVIAGGTGLYVQALVEGFHLSQKSKVKNQKYRRDYLERTLKEELQKILWELDVEAYKKVDVNNPHRLIRAIEKAQEGLKPIKVKPDFEVLQIGVTWPREILYQRIDKRVDDRFEEGMLGEVQKLLGKGVSADWLVSLGLEYRVIAEFLFKIAQLLNCSIADLPPKNNNIAIKQYNNEFELMRQQLKWKIHQFARRQETWFRRFPEIVWENDYSKIKKLVENYLS